MPNIFGHSFIKLVQSLSRVQLFVTPWTAACQASLSITNSRSLFKLMSIESVMPSNHLILCRPLLLLPSIFPSIRVFSNESVLHIRWPKYWSFSFSISPSNETCFNDFILPGLQTLPHKLPHLPSAAGSLREHEGSSLVPLCWAPSSPSLLTPYLESRLDQAQMHR